MDGNEIDRWMDGSIRIVSRVEDASTIAKRGMGEGRLGAVRSIYNWITAVIIRGEC